MRFRELRSRRDVLLVAAGAAVLAAVAGVIWLMAGAESGGETSDGGADLTLSDAEPGVDQPGTDGQAAAEDAPAGGGSPPDDEDSESGSGGGRSSNRPPVIDSPGLASNGLVLSIEPEVTDPDGDDVTLLFDVDGTTIDPAQACSETPDCVGGENPGDSPGRAAIRLDFSDIGYRSDVAVTIMATDSHGATSRETYTHEVNARTDVIFRELSLAFNDPAACFSAQETRVVSFELDLTGAVDASRSSSGFTISDSVRLAGGHFGTYDGEEPPPLGVQLSVTLSDIGTVGFPAPRQHTSGTEEVVRAFRNSPCEGTLTYVITYQTT